MIEKKKNRYDAFAHSLTILVFNFQVLVMQQGMYAHTRVHVCMCILLLNSRTTTKSIEQRQYAINSFEQDHDVMLAPQCVRFLN